MAKARRNPVHRRGGAVTIRDVAARAGVSAMTVSRVIHHNHRVFEATRIRVTRAINELAYTPNAGASILAAAQGVRIGLIHTSPNAPYMGELLVGALRGAARAAAQLVIDSWEGYDAEAELSAVHALAGRGVAGVILPPPLCDSRRIVGELLHAGVHVVAIASSSVFRDISSVRIDDYRASQEITAHLITMGHKRIGYVKGDSTQATSLSRYKGFIAALCEASITPERQLVQPGKFTYRSGLEAGEKFLARAQPPTAIIAGNDDMAAGVVSAAHQRGLTVPRDLSVVGFGDTSASTKVWPELTTVRQPVVEMADTAVDILLRGTRRADNDPRTILDKVVPHALIKRGSVAAPPSPARPLRP